MRLTILYLLFAFLYALLIDGTEGTDRTEGSDRTVHISWPKESSSYCHLSNGNPPLIYFGN